MFIKYNDGWIEVITGPMFAGKTAEIIKRAESLIYANKNFLVFKPNADTRWEKEFISSRNGKKIESITIENIEDSLKYINKKTKAVIFDEIQFFDGNVIDTLQKIAFDRIRVIVAGLDMDFLMRPFKPMPEILSISEFVTKLTAICFKCGKAASFSKRIQGSKSKTIEIGDNSYEARCRKCFKI
ncbi:MAG: thymidine kinase [Mycoplasmatales bacterium]|nr:thymidine kinase [Mycoplasmatales bacterium]